MGTMLNNTAEYAKLASIEAAAIGSQVPGMPGVTWVNINSDNVRWLMFEVRCSATGPLPLDCKMPTSMPKDTVTLCVACSTCCLPLSVPWSPTMQYSDEACHVATLYLA
jgi:hypothetical protein